MLNKEQKWYIQSGKGWSICWIAFIIVLSIFEITRKFIPVVSAAFGAMLIITLINVWMFKDDKKIRT